MVEHHELEHASAAVVTDCLKAVEPERLHNLHLVRGHRALGVVDVFLATVRLAGVPVAAKIG